MRDNIKLLIAILALVIVFILMGCTSLPVHKGCIITFVECHNGGGCILFFDDGSTFGIPQSMQEYFKPGDNICKDQK